MFQLFFVVLAVIAASIHLAVSAKRRSSSAAIVETYLQHFFFIYVGLMGVLTAYAHVFRPIRHPLPSAGRTHTNMKLE